MKSIRDMNSAESGTAIEEPVVPTQVSKNGRYFQDQNGHPGFWLGDTQWELFRCFSEEEARIILQKRARQGFTVFQVMLIGIGDGSQVNRMGERPWIDNDPATPNEAFFRHVDAIVQIAGQIGMVLAIGVFHQWHRERIMPANARAYARWVAQRYRNMPHLIWSMYPEAKPEYLPVLRELAAGLHEGDEGRHLITVHPDPSPASSSFIHGEPWLGFNSLQTWKSVELICPMVSHDYALQPAKPVVMAEGAYEAGSEYGFEVTPLWVRRQAYTSYLLGAHHTYGHNDCWRVLPTWFQALDAPGAAQMGTLKQVFLEREEWWRLIPDNTILVEGDKTQGPILNLAARHREGRWLMVYLGEPASFAADLRKIRGAKRVRAFWIDPRTGKSTPSGTYSTDRAQRFTTPTGWEDALLLVERES